MICPNYTVNLPIVNVIPKKITFETVKSQIEQVCTVNITYETKFQTFNYTYVAL
jgi:hypothetical protein